MRTSRARGEGKDDECLRRRTGGRECEAVQRDPAPLRADDFVLGAERGANGGNPRRAVGRLLRVCELHLGVEVVLCSRIPPSAVSVLIARGKPARDSEIERDVPGVMLLSVLATFIAELDGRVRDEFLGDGAETGGGIGGFVCDKLSLSFESNNK